MNVSKNIIKKNEIVVALYADEEDKNMSTEKIDSQKILFAVILTITSTTASVE